MFFWKKSDQTWNLYWFRRIICEQRYAMLARKLNHLHRSNILRFHSLEMFTLTPCIREKSRLLELIQRFFSASYRLDSFITYISITKCSVWNWMSRKFFTPLCSMHSVQSESAFLILQTARRQIFPMLCAKLPSMWWKC